MNILKKALIAVAVLLVILVAIGFVLPSKVEVKRSIVIAASPAQIQPFVANLKEWSLWAPWNQEMDPTVVYTYSEPSVGTGAHMSWTAEKIGSGVLTLTKAEPAEGIWYDIGFNNDGMITKGSMIYAPSDGGTLVTWTNTSELGGNPVHRYFGLMMDAMLGADFDKGLAKLKLVVENSQVEKAK
ncbi:MAG: SRPBCC family protein [Myxococcota bacterium]